MTRPAAAVNGALAPALAVALGACAPSGPGPRPQVVLHVDTDAPVASTSGTVDPWTDPIPLFDRLRVDVYPPGATDPCASCTNEFDVSADAFAASAVSVGIALDAGASGWVARVRLTVRRFESSAGDLDPAATVDAFVALPGPGEGEVAHVTARLSTDDTGMAMSSLDAPVAPQPGMPGASAVAQWPSATRAACSTAQPPGAVCVPGGAYWMGASSNHLVLGANSAWRRLVVVSPFWIDATEETVAEARASGGVAAIPWSGSTQGALQDFCTYTPSASSRDSLPVTCVTQPAAAKHCASRGGQLPSEAQIEYVSGGSQGHPYPWGYDQPDCGQAVWGRNGYGDFLLGIPFVCRSPSNFLAPMGGPEPPRSGSLDVAHLPGGDVFDLAGNVFEIARDSFAFDDDPCWSAPGVSRDPVCQANGTGAVLRGGSWVVGGTYLEAGHRIQIDPAAKVPQAGFRCAWPGQ